MQFKDIALDTLPKSYNDLILYNLISVWSVLFPEYSSCEVHGLHNFLLIIRIPIYMLNLDEKKVIREVNCYFCKRVVSRILLRNLMSKT